MNIDLLMNGQAEAISLSEQGMGITEYLQHLVSTGDAPKTVMVSCANGRLIAKDVPLKPDDLASNSLRSMGDGMRISMHDMLTDNDVLLFRAKPKTQGVGIGEALQELLDEVK